MATALAEPRAGHGPAPVPRRAEDAGDPRHVDAFARARHRGSSWTWRRASSRCCTPSASARCRSRSARAPLVQTIRAVGPVTRALCAARPGTVIGVRGPFGTHWPVTEARGSDLVIVAGGVGLATRAPRAPLRARAPRRLRARDPPLRRPHAGGHRLPQGDRALALADGRRGGRDRGCRRRATGAARSASSRR